MIVVLVFTLLGRDAGEIRGEDARSPVSSRKREDGRIVSPIRSGTPGRTMYHADVICRQVGHYAWSARMKDVGKRTAARPLRNREITRLARG